MGVVVIGAFLILNNSNNSKVDLLDESIIKSDTALIDSLIIFDTIPLIQEDSINPI